MITIVLSLARFQSTQFFGRDALVNQQHRFFNERKRRRYCFKRDIKLAVALFFKDGKEIARKLYFSTDLNLQGEKIVRYYRSRFQIEFLYRDAKQFTGLTTCQARSENKLDFHFNAAFITAKLPLKI